MAWYHLCHFSHATFSKGDKNIAIAFIKSYDSDIPYDDRLNCVKILNSKYAGLTVRKVKKWVINENKPNKKRGRKINTDFECDVWSQLIMCAEREIMNVDTNQMEKANQVLFNV